jgi:dTDP-4-dehydrorhamnose reductase
MKVGILGPNGFMGRYFLKHYKWIPITRGEVDLLNQKSIEEFFKKNHFSVIIHCAVEGGSMLNKEDGNVTHNNILMFENVARVFKGKIIYFSSGAAVRGNPPTDPYGLSKWIIDKRISQIENAYTLRVWGCYGSGEPDPHNRDRFKTICKQNGHISIDKDKYFDFVDIKDVMKVVFEYTIGYRTSKECNLVYPEKLKLSDWAKKFGATYEITDQTELGESYIYEETRCDLISTLPN